MKLKPAPVLIMCMALCFIGCATRPSLSMVRPTPPEYIELPSGVPVPLEVMQNTIYMLDYIDRLEIYADNLEGIIDDL